MFDDENYRAILEEESITGNKFYRNPVNGVKDHPLLHKLVEKLNNGKSPTVIFVGATGNGKSMKALRMWEILYNEMNVFKEDEFQPDEHLFYEPEHILKKMQGIGTPNEHGINPDREMLIFDEGGVNINKKDWQSTTNRAIDMILQTQRMKNCLYAFILPDIQDIDKQVIKMADYIVYVIDQGYARVSDVDVNHAYIGNNNVFPKQFPWAWHPDLPEDNKIDAYRGKENAQKNQFVDDYIEKIEKEKRDEEDEVLSGSELQEMMKDPDED